MVTTPPTITAPEHTDTPAPLRPRRQPKWIVGGVLAMALGAIGAAVLWHQATGTHQVVYVARPLEVGQEITAADLTTVSVGRLPQVQTVPGTDLDSLIGQQALVELPSGTLLPTGVVGDVGLDPGEGQLGLRLPSGRLPTTSMDPGAAILVVTLPNPAVDPGTDAADAAGGSDAAGSVTEVPARLITAPVRDEDGISWLVDIAVAEHEGPELARMAAADRVTIVLAGE